ncbi:MAG: hypothetical protein WCP18_02780 [bacterium]
MTPSYRSTLILFAFFSFLATPLFSASAASFDPNYILSDAEISDFNAMNLNDIQGFLNSQPGSLKSYSTTDPNTGITKSAAQIFYETALANKINPKYLLALVQKEQSLITSPAPEQGRLDWATGYGCPDSGGCKEGARGFYNQVDFAAWQTRTYLDSIYKFSFQPGKTYTIDGTSVTPQNNATAGLYNYTPHLHGNQNLWNLWTQYFGKKWPDGTLLKDEADQVVYLIQDGKKRQIVSKAILYSRFDSSLIITATHSDIDSYDNGTPVKYLNFSLLQSSATNNIFMIVDDEKRLVATPDLLKQLGLNTEEINAVDENELALYSDGPDITQNTIYPAGAIMKDKKTGALFYVINTIKKPILSMEILTYNFQGAQIKKTDKAELDNYFDGEPVTLPDGMLIKTKTSSSVYVVSNGQLLPINSWDIFLKMKYNPKKIVKVTKDTFSIHQVGSAITGN